MCTGKSVEVKDGESINNSLFSQHFQRYLPVAVVLYTCASSRELTLTSHCAIYNSLRKDKGTLGFDPLQQLQAVR